jgi:hypothetical protein
MDGHEAESRHGQAARGHPPKRPPAGLAVLIASARSHSPAGGPTPGRPLI